MHSIDGRDAPDAVTDCAAATAVTEPVPGPGRFALVLPERLDGTTATGVRDALSLAIDGEPGHQVVLDLSAVRVVDGVGLGLLLAGHRACRRSGRTLVLVDPSEGVLRLLAVTKLNRVLHLDRGGRGSQPGTDRVAASA